MNQLTDRPVRVRVPASAANLGPGFDAFGLALALHDRVTVRVVDAGLTVRVSGAGQQQVPRDERNLLVRAIRAGLHRLAGEPAGLQVACANRIPHARGLGSSAAAVVAGLLAARALVDDGVARLPDRELLALGSELDGHPDNVAACLSGGFTVAWSAGGRPRSVRLPVRDLTPVVYLPAGRLATEAARRLLPGTVPHVDAAANAARAALLVEALGRRPGLRLAGTADRLHQPYRAAAAPGSARLISRLRAAGLPAVLSGAGPAVIALTTAAQAARACAGPPEPGWRVSLLPVDLVGARVVPAAGRPDQVAG